MKVPLLVELLRSVDRGLFVLDEPHTLTAADKVPGSSVLLALHDGLRLTYRDLLYLMIAISDNTVTNIPIDRVGLVAVNTTMRELGMTGSTLERKMRGRAAGPGEPENWGTPDDYLHVLGAILDGGAASAASNALMRALLEGQQNSRRIGRYVPTGAGIGWGSKTGSLGGVANNVGFIAGPRGILLLAIFAEDVPEAADPERTIGLLARAAMQDTGVAAPLPAWCHPLYRQDLPGSARATPACVWHALAWFARRARPHTDPWLVFRRPAPCPCVPCTVAIRHSSFTPVPTSDSSRAGSRRWCRTAPSARGPRAAKHR